MHWLPTRVVQKSSEFRVFCLLCQKLKTQEVFSWSRKQQQHHHFPRNSTLYLDFVGTMSSSTVYSSAYLSDVTPSSIWPSLRRVHLEKLIPEVVDSVHVASSKPMNDTLLSAVPSVRAALSTECTGKIGQLFRIGYCNGSTYTISVDSISDIDMEISWSLIYAEPKVSFSTRIDTVRLHRVTCSKKTKNNQNPQTIHNSSRVSTFVTWSTTYSSDVTALVLNECRKEQSVILQAIRRSGVRWSWLQNLNAVWNHESCSPKISYKMDTSLNSCIDDKENSTNLENGNSPNPNYTTGPTEVSLAWRQHIEYIANLGYKTQSFEYHVTEHLRLSGMYWALGAASIIGGIGVMDREAYITFVKSCQCQKTGGFSGNLGHDPHLLYTLSALQILAILGDGALNSIDTEAAAEYIASLQNVDGSFKGDVWGEVDTRFVYCALCALAILGKLNDKDTCIVNIEKAVSFVVECQNFDGGFGCVPNAESHGGQIWTCVAALSIASGYVPNINIVDKLKGGVDRLGWWLCERQCDSGGLNGRPEKQADVCYSWWVLSSLAIIGREHWIDNDKLIKFILDCQDREDGGISDRPDDMADIYHTFFGLCGLSHLGWLQECSTVKANSGHSVEPIDPVFALPKNVCSRLGLKSVILKI